MSARAELCRELNWYDGRHGRYSSRVEADNALYAVDIRCAPPPYMSLVPLITNHLVSYYALSLYHVG